MQMTRTQNSILNLFTALAGQILSLLIGFISRYYFLHILGEYYLGINGLFTEILSMLSLVELGIGPAIIFCMYEPLAQNNLPQICGLLNFYKKIYTTIGLLIAFLGLLFVPFLPYLIKDYTYSAELNIIFIFFVVNSSVSYFFVYKKSLILADQKRYIYNLVHYSLYFFFNLVQIFCLISFRNYKLYLLLQITFTISENVIISAKANKNYPFLKRISAFNLDREIKNRIFKNTFAMIFHKLGGIVVISTDNMLLSMLFGIIPVGIYSNYQLILNAVKNILKQFFLSISASVGNLGVTESSEKKEVVFNVTLLLANWLYGLCSICIFNLVNPFINLWLEKDLTFDKRVVFVLCLNLYLYGIRQPLQTFRESFGLFWFDRYKPIFECVINLGISIWLSKQWGILGVFVGTFVSTISTCLWIEPLVVYKYALEVPLARYWKRFIQYLFLYSLSFAISISLFDNWVNISWRVWISKAFLCSSIITLVYVLGTMNLSERKTLLQLFGKLLLLKR